MTETEAQKVIAMLATYFPGRLPEETQIAWALEVEPHRYIDAISGARSLARAAQHPQLNALLEHVDAAKRERQRKEAAQSVSALLPAQATGLDPGRHERTLQAARAARELVESLAREKSIPGETVSVISAHNGHLTQTPQEAAERQQVLRKQAERIQEKP